MMKIDNAGAGCVSIGDIVAVEYKSGEKELVMLTQVDYHRAQQRRIEDSPEMVTGRGKRTGREVTR